MPSRTDTGRKSWMQLLFGNEMMNVVMGLLVLKICYTDPQQYYYLLAAYSFLMAYEFYEFVKVNWRVAIYGKEDEEDDEEETVEAEKVPVRRTIYPPPVDTDEELNDDDDSSDDDVSEVDLPKTDDESDDDNEEYHEAVEKLI